VRVCLSCLYLLMCDVGLSVIMCAGARLFAFRQRTLPRPRSLSPVRRSRSRDGARGWVL